ncbi:MAG TPA: alpha/beta hydrolase-fold protein [Mycobacterium sp.]|uniref:alpha/beta hydrolase n=1 Tax=Mycobacterium sp. TaxID=1785 RepID=UPI002F414891
MEGVTGSPANLPLAVLADNHTSLMHGWVPGAVQVVAVAMLLAAVGWRSRLWRLVWLPVAAVLGAALAGLSRWYITTSGLADDPAPGVLWWWIAVSGAAIAILVLGWRTAHWWRRCVSLLCVPLCLLSAGVTLNLWVGYFPTVQNAWDQITAGPLPDETDAAGIAAMAVAGSQPTHGSVLAVSIPDNASHFKHRGEIVYLPPAWFSSARSPQLPTVMMIGGEFNTPADWLRAGNAVKTIDDLAATHGGNAPVFVFVDSGGAFNNDTECVNGSRGNAADHLTKDVVPFMISKFGVSPEPAHWGVVGWSMGGTCALDLTVMHPELFSSFVDIAGNVGPEAGTKAQTIARLFGGNADAWAGFDPATVIAKHGRYTGVSGWFDVSSSNPAKRHRGLSVTDAGDFARGTRDSIANPNDETSAAETLCESGRANGISCAVVAQPGKHDWPFASNAFAAALPWLAGRLGTPGLPEISTPSTWPTESSAAPHAEPVGR